MPIGFFNLLFVLVYLDLAKCQLFNPNMMAKSLENTYNLFDDLPDGELGSSNHRRKRYALHKKWQAHILTWTLHKENINMADEFIIRNTLHRAFVNWAEVSSLRFVEIPVQANTPADINISFLKGNHGDRLPFDGPYGIVAHAYYPTIGVLHFDADEQWSLNQMEGINLYQTAVHEIGHILGLGHSNDPRASMFPQRKFDLKYGLADDDVRGIRQLYPSKHETTKNLNDNSV